MMITELLERFFFRKSDTSRSKVKQRLKFILAHDRAALTPKMLDDLRREIMAVVSKYVELDDDGLEVTLESDQRMTALIANLPIRKVRNPEILEEAPIEEFVAEISIAEIE